MLYQKSYFHEKQMQAMMDFAAQFSSRLIIVVIKYEPYVTFSFLLRWNLRRLKGRSNDPCNLIKNIVILIFNEEKIEEMLILIALKTIFFLYILRKKEYKVILIKNSTHLYMSIWWYNDIAIFWKVMYFMFRENLKWKQQST